jgi:hypothetical protein
VSTGASGTCQQHADTRGLHDDSRQNTHRSLQPGYEQSAAELHMPQAVTGLMLPVWFTMVGAGVLLVAVSVDSWFVDVAVVVVGAGVVLVGVGVDSWLVVAGGG